MGKGAPLRWLENKLLARHLHGRGIEIGALWRKFPVPRSARVYYIDRISAADLQQHYAEVSSPICAPDVVADATHLPFAPSTLDFIIASHVLEHLPFPLDALRHWHDVLRPGGVLLLKIPDKRYTFDHQRARTPLQHLIDEHANPSTFDKRAHFADWVEHVIGRPAARRSSTRSYRNCWQPTTAFTITPGSTKTSARSPTTRATPCIWTGDPSSSGRHTFIAKNVC